MTTPNIAQAAALRAGGFSEEEIIAAAGQEAAAATRPITVEPIQAIDPEQQPQVEALAAEGFSREDIAEAVSGGLVEPEPEATPAIDVVALEPAAPLDAIDRDSTLEDVLGALKANVPVSRTTLERLDIREEDIVRIQAQQAALQPIKAVPGVFNTATRQFNLVAAIRAGISAEMLAAAGFAEPDIFQAFRSRGIPERDITPIDTPPPVIRIADLADLPDLTEEERPFAEPEAVIAQRVEQQRFDAATQELSPFLVFSQEEITGDPSEITGIRIEEALDSGARPQALRNLGISDEAILAAQVRLIRADPTSRGRRERARITPEAIVPTPAVRAVPPPGEEFETPESLQKELRDAAIKTSLQTSVAATTGAFIVPPQRETALQEGIIIETVDSFKQGDITEEEALFFIDKVKSQPITGDLREAGYIVPGLGTFLAFQDFKDDPGLMSGGFFITSAALDVVIFAAPVIRATGARARSIFVIPKNKLEATLRNQRGGIPADTLSGARALEAVGESRLGQIVRNVTAEPPARPAPRPVIEPITIPRRFLPPEAPPAKPKPVGPPLIPPPERTRPSPMPGTEPITKPLTKPLVKPLTEPAGAPVVKPGKEPRPRITPIPERITPREPIVPPKEPAPVSPRPQPFTVPRRVAPGPSTPLPTVTPRTTPVVTPIGVPTEFTTPRETGFRPTQAEEMFGIAPTFEPLPEPLTQVQPETVTETQLQPLTITEVETETRVAPREQPEVAPRAQPITKPLTEPELETVLQPDIELLPAPLSLPALEPILGPVVETIPAADVVAEPEFGLQPEPAPQPTPSTRPGVRATTTTGLGAAVGPRGISTARPSTRGAEPTPAKPKPRPRITLPDGKPLPEGEFASVIRVGQGENRYVFDLVKNRRVWSDRDPDGRSPQETLVALKTTRVRPPTRQFKMGFEDVTIDGRTISFKRNPLAAKKAAPKKGLRQKRSRL